MKKLLSLILLSFTLSSCHHLFPQEVAINPKLNYSSQAGSKNSFTLNVEDKRVDKSIIGNRWQVFGGTISNNKNFSKIIKEKFTESLLKSGFTLGNKSKINLLISNLEYNTKLGVFFMSYNCSFSLNVLVKGSNDNLKFNDVFNKKIERSSLIAPFAGTNEEFINEVISEVLNEVIHNPEFINSLIN